MAIRIKKGKYVYETHNYWDKNLKKYKAKWKYIGIMDPTTKEITPKKEMVPVEKQILDYGDVSILNEFCKLSGLTELLNRTFGCLSDKLMALVFYRLIHNKGMNLVNDWYLSSYAKVIFPNLSLSSQRISEILPILGEEVLWQKFFAEYTSLVYKDNGVIIDSTGLTNEIKMAVTALGYHGGEINNETRLIMVVDRKSGDPLFFRYVAGNIVDVSTLQNTIREIEIFGIKSKYALLDAGYYSETNIRSLYETNISFLVRLPSGRKIYKSALMETIESIESPENSIMYNGRLLFIKPVKTKIVDDYEGYVYVCRDANEKNNDMTKIYTEYSEDPVKYTKEKLEENLAKAGVFMLVSPELIPISKLLEFYYMRDSVEKLFEISKSYADILPLRVHSEASLRGILMISFIAVIIYKNLRQILPGNMSLANALFYMHSQKAKLFENHEVIVLEPTKKQRLISEAVANTVGKFSGN